jgi:parvulin-like peptidyl-prolyl isomerase
MKISFTARLFIYSALLAYVAIDLYACSGPLRKAIDRRKSDSPEAIEDARKAGIVGIVLGRPITTSQVDRAARERLWLEGKSWQETPLEQRRLVRKAVLTDLVDHQLIRSKIAANKEAERASEAEVSDRVKSLLARFTSRSEMEQSMKSQGIASEEELKLRMAAIIEMEKYLDRQLQPLLQVSDEEVQEFYQKHQSALAIPEMIHVRHVFWATLEKDAIAVKNQAEAALAAWQKKEKTIEQLVQEHSEDERSKMTGGNLGWISRTSRLPADFSEPLFSVYPQQPTLFQTKLGWHLAEVIDRRPPSPRSVEQCRDEIRQALADQKRTEALQNIRSAIRESHRLHIHLYPTVLDGMP